MATHKGSEGIVKIGSNTVAEVTGFSFDETADTIEDTELSDSARTYVSDLTSFSGSIDCMWDETDTTGQGAMTAGASVTLNLYPEGATTGDTYYSGTALITSISRANAIGAMVTASFSFQGTGALTASTV
jgi:hypothetical protein|tara:strand:+ start:5151 stop:5540 length:390 start_codon:yes stop_codon:yes gene_type:complete